MKRIVFSVCTVLLAITASYGQKFRVGVHAGVDAAKISIAGASEGPLTYKPELTAGISGEAALSSTFSLQLEANYSQQGVGVINADGTTAASIALDYVTIPLLAKLNATPRFSLYAGPQVGFLLSAYQKSSAAADRMDMKDLLESTDIYAVFGGGYRFANGVSLDARYHLGSQKLQKDPNAASIKNIYLSFRVGYSFGVGK